MLFVVENALYVAPVWIVANKERRNNAGWQFVAAILFIAASALYRFNTYWFAYNAHVPWRYFPSLLEILVVIGLIGMEVVLYLAAIHFFPILPASRPVLASSEK
jgi:Ni/Fe-hydrogenase subunit HybB-like protein